MFIQENAFETAVCEMAAILSRPQRVKQNIKLYPILSTLLYLQVCVTRVWLKYLTLKIHQTSTQTP